MESSVGGGEGGSTMGTLKLFLGNFWPRNKYYPQIHIRVDRNCQPTWVTQNAIPEEQELILLGLRYSPGSQASKLLLHFCVALFLFILWPF